jgi:MarR-like DNA-binding transcriptional regulator SgrR of sgrS sRNA
MRQLNRLNQYQRLWQASLGESQLTSVAEIAGRCICSERHVRTLLGQWQSAGWLRWQAQSGRGKRGELEFLQSPTQLRTILFQQQLDQGLSHQALELVQIAPEQLNQLLKPFMGGQWLDDRPTLRIPYYRPLDPLNPLDMPGRAEQHLAGQIFSGLTRFQDDRVVADLAHHWQCSEDGLSWFFFLRPQLYWHSGERVTSLQIMQHLQRVIDSPAGAKQLASVKSLSLPQSMCLQIDLHRPDYWLTWRLATVLCLLTHPDDPAIGSGPWKLSHWSPELVRIENHERYYGNQPLMQMVEYWITPQLFDKTLGTSCRHPVQIAIGEQHELSLLRPVSRRISLGFCYLALKLNGALSPAQAQKILALIRSKKVIEELPLEEGLITPSLEMLPGWPVPEISAQEETDLPATLNLHYHLPVELHAMAEKLQQVLAEEGCQLRLHFHPAKNWQGYSGLETADIIMGDRLIGEAPAFTLESWLKLDPLWPTLLGEVTHQQLLNTLEKIQCNNVEAERLTGLQHAFHQLMAQSVITPLFNYRYQVSAPPDVEDIALNAWGWFDFSRAWIPPPVAIP